MKHYSPWFSLIVGCAAFGCPGAKSEPVPADCPGIASCGRTPDFPLSGRGRVRASIVRGEHLYLLTTDGLEIFARDAGTLLGWQPSPGSESAMWSLSVEGHYAYYLAKVENGNGGRLVIFDVQNPNAPLRVGQVDLAFEWLSTELSIHDGHAYVWTNGRPGVTAQVIDVSQPANPSKVSEFNFEGSYPGESIKVGNIVYVGTWGSIPRPTASTIRFNLAAIDVSEPSAPVIRSIFNTADFAGRTSPRAMVAQHDAQSILLALYAGPSVSLGGGIGKTEVLKIDTRDPANLLHIDTLTFPETETYALRSDGTRTYLATKRGVLAIENGAEALEAGAPLELWLYPEGTAHNGASASAGSVFAVTPKQLREISFADPSQPQLQDPIDLDRTPGSTADAAVVGRTIYIADGKAGLRIFQQCPGEMPEEFARHLEDQEIRRVEANESLVAVKIGDEVRVYDATNLNELPLVFTATIGPMSDFAVKDNVLFVSRATNLSIFDTQSEAPPTTLLMPGFLSDPPVQMRIEGDSLVLNQPYVADVPLIVANIANPKAPTAFVEIEKGQPLSLVAAGAGRVAFARPDQSIVLVETASISKLIQYVARRSVLPSVPSLSFVGPNEVALRNYNKLERWQISPVARRLSTDALLSESGEIVSGDGFVVAVNGSDLFQTVETNCED